MGKIKFTFSSNEQNLSEFIPTIKAYIKSRLGHNADIDLVPTGRSNGEVSGNFSWDKTHANESDASAALRGIQRGLGEYLDIYDIRGTVRYVQD